MILGLVPAAAARFFPKHFALDCCVHNIVLVLYAVCLNITLVDKCSLRRPVHPWFENVRTTIQKGQ